MAENQVQTTFFANEADAAAAIARLEKKYEDLANKVKHAGKSSKEASKESADGLAAIAPQLATIGAGFATVGETIKKVFESSKEWQKMLDEAAQRFDDFRRRTTAQGGDEHSIKMIERSAQVGGISVNDAQSLWKSLHEKGIDEKTIDASIDDLARNFAQARLAKGGDLGVGQFVGAAMKTMDLEGPKNADTLKKAANDMVAMTSGTPMVADDIMQLSSTLEQLRKGRGGFNNPRVINFLRAIHTEFDEVNQHGEDFASVMTLISDRMKQFLPPEKWAAELAALTGDAGMAKRAIAGVGRMGANSENLDFLLANATEGIGPDEQRRKNTEEMNRAKKGGDFMQRAKNRMTAKEDEEGLFSLILNPMRSTLLEIVGALPGGRSEAGLQAAGLGADGKSGVMSRALPAIGISELIGSLNKVFDSQNELNKRIDDAFRRNGLQPVRKPQE